MESHDAKPLIIERVSQRREVLALNGDSFVSNEEDERIGGSRLQFPAV